MTTETMDRLIETRKDLAWAASMARDGSAFPGSRRWLAAQEAERPLSDFDAAHPEVVTEINAREVVARRARLAARDYMGA